RSAGGLDTTGGKGVRSVQEFERAEAGVSCGCGSSRADMSSGGGISAGSARVGRIAQGVRRTAAGMGGAIMAQRQPAGGNLVRVARLADVQSAGCLTAQVGGHTLALFARGDEVHA